MIEIELLGETALFYTASCEQTRESDIDDVDAYSDSRQ